MSAHQANNNNERTKHMFKSIAAALTCLTITTTSFAGNSAFRDQVEGASRQGQLVGAAGPVSKLRLLELPGSGRANDEVAEEILSELSSDTGLRASDVQRVDEVGDEFLLAGAEWSLQVRAEGSHVRYRNLGAERSNEAVKRLPKLPPQQTESLARAFIKSRLQRFLKKGSGESFTLWKVQYEHEGGGDDSASTSYDRVVSSQAIFTRTVDGVPFVGGGSKILVELANDGTVIGFDFDWPELMDGKRTQKVAADHVVIERSASLFPATKGTYKVAHHECGYFDPGLGYRDEYAPIQSACVTWVVRERLDPTVGEIVRSGVLVVAPAGETVEHDGELERSHPALNGKLGRSPQSGAFGTRNHKAERAITN
jgi:hypothetical protein